MVATNALFGSFRLIVYWVFAARQLWTLNCVRGLTRSTLKQAVWLATVVSMSPRKG
jgi:hypothetical protein